MNQPNVKSCDVVVVGAGMAGLAAAELLDESGCDCLLVEASSAAGGRVRSQVSLSGLPYEAGAQFLSSEMTEMLAYAAASGLRSEAEERPIVRQSVDGLNGMIGPAPIAEPTIPAIEALPDASSMADFVRSTYGSAVGAAYAKSWYVEYFCSELERIDARAAREYLVRDTSIGSDIQLDGPLGRIVALIEGRLKRPVLYGCLVDGVHTNGGLVHVHANGEVLRCKAAIVALPIPLADRIVARSDHSPAVLSALDSFIPGAVHKTSIFVPWSGAASSVEPGAMVEVVMTGEPTMVAVDSSRRGAPMREIIVFAGGDAADALASMDLEVRNGVVWAFVGKAFGFDETVRPEIVHAGWLGHGSTGGGYASQVATGRVSDARSIIAAAPGPIWFASTDIADRFAGHMEGAVRSGRAAARAVMEALRHQRLEGPSVEGSTTKP